MTDDTSLLDRLPESSSNQLLAGAGAICVHAAVLAIATVVGAHIAHEVTKPAVISQLIEIEGPPELTPPPQEKAPDPVSKPIHTNTANPTHEPPAPAAAQAGQVLGTAEDVVDFGDEFVVGKGSNYAGGLSEANGTATHAVRDRRASGTGVPGGVGSAAAPGIDLSRAAQLAGGSAWDCPFPVEADDAGVDHAVVTLRVEVGADGRVVQASATRDPGHGFGREARRCALYKRWAPGLDREGRAASSVTVVNVRFER